MKVGWTPREPPLPPVAALARGPAAARLVRRLLACDDATLGRLEGVGGDGVVLVLGADVPWVDGLTWLGRDPDAPALLLPTAVRPDVPADLLQSALLRRVPGPAPVAALPDAVVPAGAARPLARAHLERWLGR